MKDNQIIFKDDNGKEIVFNILFTFENGDSKYVLCYKENEQNDIIPFKYDDLGNAYIVEDENELNMIQDCIDSYDNIGDDDEKTS